MNYYIMHALIDFLFIFLINLAKSTIIRTKTNGNKLLRRYMSDKLILNKKLWKQKKDYSRN